jgi:hypothetical protein
MLAPYASLYATIQITGDGRNDFVQLYPVQAGLFTISPPASLSAATPALHAQIALGIGDVTVNFPTLPAGTSLSYVVLVPPTTSTNVVKLKQGAPDTGLTLVAGLPVWLAQGGALSIVLNASQTETWDVYYV